jgi:hypothetical protein
MFCGLLYEVGSQFILQIFAWRRRQTLIEDDMEGYSSGVIEVTSQHFPGRSEEIHEKSHNKTMDRPVLEYTISRINSTALPLHQPLR